MRIPKFNVPDNKKSSMHVYFDGYTDKEYAEDSLLKDSEGLFLDEYPVLASGKLSRSAIPADDETTGITALFFHEGDYYFVDGTDFKRTTGVLYVTTVMGALTAGKKKSVYFNEKYYILPDMKVFDPDAETLVEWTDGPGVVLTDLCVSDNRLWGVAGDMLMACALGDADDWTTFDNTELDAYTVDTGTKGDFTTIRPYNGHVNVFKEGMMFALYGSIPSNFSLYSVTEEVGCIDRDSIVEAEGVLYFMSRNGYMGYDGDFPIKVSNGIDALTGVDVCIAAKGKTKIYVSDGTTVYTYNLDKQKLQSGTVKAWMKQGSVGDVNALVSQEGQVYEVTKTDIREYESGSGAKSKTVLLKTPYFDESTNYKKYTHRLILVMYLYEFEALEVTVSYDNGDSEEIIYSTTERAYDEYKEFRLPITIKRCRNYSIQIEGMAYEDDAFKLLSLEREFLVGSKEMRPTFTATYDSIDDAIDGGEPM